MEYATIIIAVITFIWTVVSFFLLNQANQKLQAQQSVLEKSVFAFGRQFETEIEILKDLSLKLLRLYFAVYKLYPSGLYYEPFDHDEKIEYRKNVLKDCNDEFNKYIDSLYSNAAFIDNDLYVAFDEIRKKIRLQMEFYPDFMIKQNEEMIRASDGLYQKSWKVTEEINQDREQIISKIRSYLKSK